MERVSLIRLFVVAVITLVASGLAEAQCLSLPCDSTVSSSSAALSVTNTGSGRALEGHATSGIGVIGISDNRGVVGTQGETSCAGTYAVGGCATTGDGILGRSPNRAVIGVQGGGSCAGTYAVGGCATTGDGILGRSPNRAVIGVQGGGSCAGTYAVGGCATTGDGVVGRSSDGFAGRFEGRVLVQVLEIVGGTDIAEPFNVAHSEVITPGMLVSIDPAQPGQLRVSSQPYDRTVAGVVSGANGVTPGITLKSPETLGDGLLPVALTGRVYCWADTSNGAIEPGDLLTTSAIPGHAMKVTNYAQAQGAIVGKAMSALQTGAGHVLVLVGLQ